MNETVAVSNVYELGLISITAYWMNVIRIPFTSSM
jgi:hypothetical protein